MRRPLLLVLGLLSVVLIGPTSANAQHAATAPVAAASAAATAGASLEDGVAWYDVTDWGVEGRILPEQERLRWFDRFPAAAEKSVTKNVWGLSRDSAGMMARFTTDSPVIHVDYELRSDRLAMPHMPATGVSGVDLYARDDEGNWRWVQVSRPTVKQVKAELISGLAPGLREYAVFLPLYNGVESLRIGVAPDSKFEGLAPRERPIVFYGTSITHGACASRPGMVHTAILGRKLDHPVVNLGFSGNGRMDLGVADWMVQVDAAMYVIDCLPNMQPGEVAEKCEPLVRRIRESKPDTPIVLVEDRRFTNSWITPAKTKFHDENHAALRAAYDRLVAAGVQGLHYISGDLLYGDDTEGATDASHANDLGFMRQADVFEPVLREVLAAAAEPSLRKLVIMAGKPSHPPRMHEFNAGVQLLAKCLRDQPDVQVEVLLNGWPKDESVFEGADGIVFFMDGGGRHEAVQEDGRRLKLIDQWAQQGVGLGFMHYGVEVVPEQAGEQFRRWIGGHYEHMFSCNPMWEPSFTRFPDHPITRGVQPFQIKDEWYFNMRFAGALEGNVAGESEGLRFTPILVAAPADEVRDGPYVYPPGPYEHIQAAKGRAETMMWAVERADGGRGFGFTGGHFHDNWANEPFRKVVLNALLWVAKADVPPGGVESVVTSDDLDANLDPKR